jgi:AMP nucleosidase
MIDLSCKRLQHYTGTNPKDFQKYILLTNYNMYMDEFKQFAKNTLQTPGGKYNQFLCPPEGATPQMPAYHLKSENNEGITIINIGIGPSNAKTITDHLAVLRPDVRLMLGHCAGLRNSQKIGDYVSAQAYLRKDKVLDDTVPLEIPIPALFEIQNSIENAIQSITQKNKDEMKNFFRTGTVISVADRDWELDKNIFSISALSLSRAIGLDMESATIATNGYRFRVPYGTLLSVSDKPLHGELKLPSSAKDFYERHISIHLEIGIKVMEILREEVGANLHSRKLRSFKEVGFR